MKKTPKSGADGQVRLQKFMADCGVASRRACEEIILEGRVKVDGKVVRQLGTKVNPINTKVEVDNQLINTQITKTYLAFHKPIGILSTMSDDSGRPCLGDFFGHMNERLFHVGRLDKESEGLILLTNDGAWAHRVTHPSFEILKSYLVLCEEEVSNQQLEKVKNGIDLEDGFVKPLAVSRKGAWVELVIHEGRNQIVRRMFEAVGNPVTRLVRTSIGSIKLGELPVGKWRSLQEPEITKL